jgi:hypothetical protein
MAATLRGRRPALEKGQPTGRCLPLQCQASLVSIRGFPRAHVLQIRALFNRSFKKLSDIFNEKVSNMRQKEAYFPETFYDSAC